MFSLYSKSRLHSFGEIINRYRFWWMSPPTVETDWDFAGRNLRSSRWLHRRIDVDFNGWFMCLIPTEVLRTIGLSLPLFIKWDDSEFGVRAGDAGFPTVTLPGAAVWHVPWTDKNDALDWQSYFHQRNRTIAALLHSPYEHGGRMVRESFNHQVKHLFSMQYSTAELRHLALEDVLAGPEQLHGDLLTKLPELQAKRKQYADAQTTPDPEAFPAVRREKPPKKGQDPTQPKGTGRPARRRGHQRGAAGPPGARARRAAPRGAARRDGREVVDDRAVRLRRRLDARRHQRVVVPARHRGVPRPAASGPSRSTSGSTASGRGWPAATARRCPTSSRPTSGPRPSRQRVREEES